MKLIIIFILILTSQLQSQWIDLNPVQPLEDYKKIDFINQDTGWIVGNNGMVLFTNDGGVSWDYRNTPPVDLDYVDFVNQSTGYVSNRDGVMYKTTNGGINWLLLNMNNNLPIFSYYFADINSGIVAAGNNLIKTSNGGLNWNTILTGSGRFFLYTFFLNSQTGWVSSYNGELLKTTNFGNNWSSSTAPWWKMFFVDENTGWMYPGEYYSNSLKKTTNGGIDWVDQPNPMYYLLSLGFINNNTGYGVGSSDLMRTTNGGVNWIQYPFDIFGSIEDINIVNANTAVITGDRNLVAKTTNTGLNWNNISKKIGTNIGIRFFNSNNGYIHGEAGVFATSIDGGNSWIKKTTGTLETFSDAYFLNVNTGWLISNSQKLFKTINGGINWDISVMNTSKSLSKIYFANPNTGWISCDSGTILFSTNGGSSWLINNTGINSRISKIIQFGNQNIAAATLDSIILVSTNLGSSWIVNYVSGDGLISDICLTDNNTAFAFGYINTVKTTNSGLNWALVSNNLPNGGKSVNYIGNTFYALTGSNVYKSVNGGINWANSEINNSPFVCFSISFVDVNTGWVAGQNGTIFRNTNSSAIGIEPISNEIPKSFVLYQNYPNPFNPVTKIDFEIPKSSIVNLIIYDIIGKQVSTLVSKQLNTGKYSVVFDGITLPSGIYFYRITAGNFTESKKMLLVK